MHNFSKVALLLLIILNALTKLFIRFLAIGKPKRPACMAVENKFHSMCLMLIIQENCIAKTGSHTSMFFLHREMIVQTCISVTHTPTQA